MSNTGLTPKARASQSRRNANYRRTPNGMRVVWRLQDERTKNNKELINKAKDVECADCGGRYPTVCMDFDHRPGTVKAGNISGMLGQPVAKLLAEMAKCDVVCANCHRIRTAEHNPQRRYWQDRRAAKLAGEPARAQGEQLLLPKVLRK